MPDRYGNPDPEPPTGPREPPTGDSPLRAARDALDACHGKTQARAAIKKFLAAKTQAAKPDRSQP